MDSSVHRLLLPLALLLLRQSGFSSAVQPKVRFGWLCGVLDVVLRRDECTWVGDGSDGDASHTQVHRLLLDLMYVDRKGEERSL